MVKNIFHPIQPLKKSIVKTKYFYLSLINAIYTN